VRKRTLFPIDSLDDADDDVCSIVSRFYWEMEDRCFNFPHPEKFPLSDYGKALKSQR
jgi:hypothetical protein